MLDVITDFWKPVKKPASNSTPDFSKLQIGSALTFGYVPQTMLSGRKLTVSAINTYQFNGERMTSFVLAQEGEDMVSLIIAGEQNEPYLALSRRIPFAERMKMFDPALLEAVVEQPDAARLMVRDIEHNWKHWIVPSYKKEIEGIKGSMVRGDFRNAAAPTPTADQSFDYVLLTSDSNEYAIEIERYAEGRLELYATIYRRVNDVVEIDHGGSANDDKLSAPPVLEIIKPEPLKAETKPEALTQDNAPKKPAEPETAKAAEVSPAPAEKAAETTSEAKPEEAQKPAFLAHADNAPGAFPNPANIPVSQQVNQPPAQQTAPKQATPLFTPSFASAPQAQPIAHPNAAAAAAAASSTPSSSPLPTLTEKKPMQFPMTAASNGAYNEKDVKVSSNTVAQENDAIECDLRVANKIIEEAIRNEMRLSDVVRRVIALPVSNPESVQIPITLTESDFQLLAIRYSLSANDRNAIKARIIEELGDFSGGKKQ